MVAVAVGGGGGSGGGVAGDGGEGAEVTRHGECIREDNLFLSFVAALSRSLSAAIGFLVPLLSTEATGGRSIIFMDVASHDGLCPKPLPWRRWYRVCQLRRYSISGVAEAADGTIPIRIRASVGCGGGKRRCHERESKEGILC